MWLCCSKRRESLDSTDMLKLSPVEDEPVTPVRSESSTADNDRKAARRQMRAMWEEQKRQAVGGRRTAVTSLPSNRAKDAKVKEVTIKEVRVKEVRVKEVKTVVVKSKELSTIEMKTTGLTATSTSIGISHLTGDPISDVVDGRKVPARIQ